MRMKRRGGKGDERRNGKELGGRRMKMEVARKLGGD